MFDFYSNFRLFFSIYTPLLNFFRNFNKKIPIYFYFWHIFNTPPQTMFHQNKNKINPCRFLIICKCTSLRLETTGSEVDHLDCRAAFLPQQYIFRLHITVYDVLFEHDPHALENRVGKATHQMDAEALVVILLDQLV